MCILFFVYAFGEFNRLSYKTFRLTGYSIVNTHDELIYLYFKIKKDTLPVTISLHLSILISFFHLGLTQPNPYDELIEE